jgi:NADH-quinone oxidoreductase subunit M
VSGASISTLIALPLLAALVVSVVPLRVGRGIAWLALALEALLSLRLLEADYGSAGYRFIERAQLGPLHYAVGVDGLSLWLVLATLWLLPLALMRAEASRRATLAVLVAEASAVGALCAFDLLLLWLCFQLTLLPILLVRGEGAGDDERTAQRRVLWVRGSVEGLAGLGMLLGVLWLGGHYRAEAGEGSFDLVELGRLLLPVQTQRGYFLLFALPCLLRLGLPPLHGVVRGQLESTRGPIAALPLLLGAPLGFYVLVRVPMTLFPAGSHRTGVTLAAVAAAGVALVGLAAIGGRLPRRGGLALLPAPHAGLSLLGLFSITVMGIAGALLFVVAMSAALVLVALVGDGRRPAAGWLRALPLVAALGLPPFGGFAGLLLVYGGALGAEHLGLNGTPLVCVAALGLALLAVGVLRHGAGGPTVAAASEGIARDGAQQSAAARAPREGAMRAPAWLVPLLLLVVLGLHPSPVLRRVEPFADHFTRVYAGKLQVSDSHPARRGLLERVPTQ